ncbi:hypothetical protein GN156_05760 [bacterium LRH843]|nr:hypothetical protein [bacterium LRH843]
MKKKWLIPLILVAILLIAGNKVFNERLETAGEQVVEAGQERDVPVDEEGKPVVDEATGTNKEMVDKETKDHKTKVLGTESEKNDDVGNAISEEKASEKGTETEQDQLNKDVGEQKGSGKTGNIDTKTTVREKIDSNKAEEKKPAGEKESVTAIKNRYFPEFQKLEWEQNGKIEGLVQRAFDDYMASEDGAFNANKYRAEAEGLQAASDAAFYAKYSQMQADLAANGHSKQAASDFERTYQSKKAARENELRGIVNGL